MKLRAKLILLVLSIVLPITTGVTWFLLDRAENFFHNQADKHLNDQLLIIETQLQDTTENAKRITSLIAKRTNIKKILHLGSSLGINQTLNQIMKIYPYFNYILVLDRDGEVYAANTQNAEGKKIDGEMVLGLNVKSDYGFEQLLGTEASFGIPGKDPYLSTMGLSPTQSQWFSAPVYRGRHLLGWVVVSYDWFHQINTLFRQTKQRLQQQKDPVTEILLLDHDQRILTGGQPGNIWSSGEDDWIAMKSFKIHAMEYMLVISSDKTRLLQPLIQARTTILIGVIMTSIVLLVGLFLILTYTLIRKIRKLYKATEVIGEGNLSHRIGSLGKDELGDLANNFNNMADALWEAKAFLEQKVDEQTADIQQQKEELQRSNEELDKFAYVASHDLKAPLRGIDQLATWIVEDFDDQDATKGHLRVMRNRVKRMERLLDDLLEYSRIGRADTKLKEVDTRAVLEISFELASPPETFQIVLGYRLPVFKTIAVPFELVLRNLINNAVKHHDRKDGKITVTVEDEGDAYLFKIQDDGPGIPPKHHEKIFEIFKTLKPRDQVEGSGMGLAMIKKIVTTYGGSIAVLSETGQGACFCLTWPKIIVGVQDDSDDLVHQDRSERVNA